MTDLLVRYMKKKNVVTKGNFDLTSGGTSNYYVDIKSFLTDPHLLYLASLKVIPLSKFDVIAGVEVGSIPLAVMVSYLTTYPYAIVRKKPTGHGKNSVIIGDVEDKDVVLIEDVTTTGESASMSAIKIRNRGGRIDTVITIVDREQGAEQFLASNGIRLIPLVKLSELIENER